MKRYISLLTTLFVLSASVFGGISVLSGPIDAAGAGSELMKAVTESQRHSSSALELRMVMTSPNGEQRVRTLQTLALEQQGVTKTMTVFLSPAAVKNTRMLTVEQPNGPADQWMFLPSLGKVKRVSASERSGSFMGSEFSYADMAALTSDDQQASHALIGYEIIDGTELAVVESIPLEKGDYGKTVSWIDPSRHAVVQVEFYGQDRITKLKTLTCNAFKTFGTTELATIMVMTSTSEARQTSIEVLQARFDISIPDGYFTIAFLETGRIVP